MNQLVEQDDRWRSPLPAEITRPPTSGVRLGSLPADSEQGLRFVQDRLALFGKTLFLISLMFLVFTSGVDLIRDGGSRIADVGRTSHVIGTLIALALWRVARSRRELSGSTLQALDAAATLSVCASYVVMGHHFAQPYGFYTGLLAVGHVNIARAVIVPSVPLRTFVIGSVSFAGLVLSRGMLPIPADLPQTVATRARGILEALLWSAAGSAVATVASRVVYGLQERALEARQLGQYALEEKIGEGGMGEIYRARHAMLRRPTAVKLLSGNGSEEQLRRFEKEVQLTARLTHPNTISIYDYGRTPDGTFYYAMELLEGFTLEELVERHGPLPASRVIHVLLQAAGALTEAHGIGLIHRDVKPANLYLCKRGGVSDIVKVLDFGLVREVRGDAAVTRSNINVIVGTPLYLSPEAILSPERIDGRADLYALGAVAYFLLTGTPPFTGQSVVEVCSQHLHAAPEPPSQRVPVPEDLERVILACLAKDRADRPQTARELAVALRACRDANGWNEADADAWWTTHPALDRKTPAPEAPPPATAKACRKFCCVDLSHRLAKVAAEGAAEPGVRRSIRRTRPA